MATNDDIERLSMLVPDAEVSINQDALIQADDYNEIAMPNVNNHIRQPTERWEASCCMLVLLTFLTCTIPP